MSEQNKKPAIALALLILGTALMLFAGLDMFYRAGSAAFENSINRSLDALVFELRMDESRQRLEELRARTAAEREQTRRETMTVLLAQRKEDCAEELLLLVNPWNPVPADYNARLSQVEDGYLVDRRCAAALTQMLSDCRAAGNLPVICSAYRTEEYQRELFENKVMRVMATGVMPGEAEVIAARSVAVPGTSEHQLGLAVDIIDETYVNLDRWQENTAVQRWLMANCWRYGFILRYPNAKSEVTGIIYEPWHYRYVGAETAQAVTASGLCFEEYLLTLE